jgi:hypothetical protein
MDANPESEQIISTGFFDGNPQFGHPKNFKKALAFYFASGSLCAPRRP